MEIYSFDKICAKYNKDFDKLDELTEDLSKGLFFSHLAAILVGAALGALVTFLIMGG